MLWNIFWPLDYQIFFDSVFGALYRGIDGSNQDEEDDYIENAKDWQAAIFWIRLWACPSKILSDI